MVEVVNRNNVRGKAVWAFALLASATLIAAVLVSQGLLPQGDVLAAAVVVDLMVTLPLLFLATVVMTGRARPLAVLAVVVAGGLMARLLVPGAISWAGFGVVLAMAELVVIVMTVDKAWVTVRRLKDGAERSGDMAAEIRQAVTNTVGAAVPGRLIAADLSLVTYAVVGWWRQPELPSGAASIDVGGGSTSISLGLGLAVLFEGVALHLLLWRWHPTVAVIHGLVALWALLWILGDFHGLRLRPSYLVGDRLVFRQGLRWQLEVAKGSVLATRRAVPEDLDHKSPDRLDLSGGDGPTHVIELNRAYTAHGLFGERQVSGVAVRLDSKETLEAIVLENDPKT